MVKSKINKLDYFKRRQTFFNSYEVLKHELVVRTPVWRLRSLLMDSCLDFVSNSFFNSFMIPSTSITLDEGSVTFILARHKEVVRSARVLSHVPLLEHSMRILKIKFLYIIKIVKISK